MARCSNSSWTAQRRGNALAVRQGTDQLNILFVLRQLRLRQIVAVDHLLPLSIHDRGISRRGFDTLSAVARSMPQARDRQAFRQNPPGSAPGRD